MKLSLIILFKLSLATAVQSQDSRSDGIDDKFELLVNEYSKYSRGSIDSLKKYGHKLYKLAHESDDAMMVVRAEITTAYIQERLGNLDSSKYHYLKALSTARNNNFREREKIVLSYLGLLNYQHSKYNEALKYQLQSLKLREADGNKEQIANTYNNIGLVYYRIKDFEKAIASFNKAADINKTLGLNLARILLNLGLCYAGLDDHRTAMSNYRLAIELCQRNCQGLLAEAYNGIGVSMLEQHKYAEAYSAFTKSIAVSKSNQLLQNLVLGYYYLSKTQMSRGSIEDALSLSAESLDLAKSCNLTQWIGYNYQQLALIHSKLGDYHLAYKLQVKYDSINSELLNKGVIKDMADIQANYEQYENQKIIKKQDKELAARTTYLVITLVLFFFISLIVIILYRNNRYRKRANKQIRETLTELRTTQDQLVAQEKMAALGQLVSGIAHEINTPLGAIQGLISPVSDHFSFVVSQLHHGLKDIPGDKFGMVLGWVQKYTSKDTLISTLARRNHKKRLMERLSERGLSQRRDLADKLLDIGITAEDETIESLLSLRDPVKMIDLLHSIVMHERGTAQMETVVNKISKMVSALQTYSQPNRSGDRSTLIDLRENIDHSLVLLANEFKHGIRLVKQYPEKLSLIKGNPDSLGQVWTNVLMNAIQAVEGKGTITISVEELPGSIVVKVMDDGYGIPGEARDKIFEAFYTTKQRGYGTGLGLHISKRIVEQHRGEINLENKIGTTIFGIKIPKSP